jgi:hypothetical protein
VAWSTAGSRRGRGLHSQWPISRLPTRTVTMPSNLRARIAADVRLWRSSPAALATVSGLRRGTTQPTSPYRPAATGNGPRRSGSGQMRQPVTGSPRRPHPEGKGGRRPAGTNAGKIRPIDQPQDREGTRLPIPQPLLAFAALHTYPGADEARRTLRPYAWKNKFPKMNAVNSAICARKWAAKARIPPRFAR